MFYPLYNNARDWGARDLECVIKHVLRNYPSHKKFLIGHSIGGQLVGFASSAPELDKIILVAAQSGYWKLWSGVGKVKMWFNWHLLFPLLIKLFGYLPSKRIAGMENLPKNVAKQWSGWGRQQEYLLSDIPLAETAFEKIETNITSISIEGDQFAPHNAVDWMSEKYSAAEVKRIHLLPQDYQTKHIGHFGVFRKKFKDNLWQLLLGELKAN